MRFIQLKVRYSFLLLVSVLFISCVSSESDIERTKIRVFSAASMQDAMRDLANEFEKKEDVDVVINAASSGILARQIQKGAQADQSRLSSNRHLSISVFLQNSAIRILNVFPSGILSSPIVLPSSPAGKMPVPDNVLIRNNDNIAKDRKILLVG
ncbi:MAG: substrate-binding domain-containing protein [Bacteroidales bacterium]